MGYSYYNPNPARKSVGDCTVRALSKALGQSWGETYAGLALDGYTVSDFARNNPEGTFILSMPGRHVLCVQDGHWYDSWDSGGEEPVYYWTKES